ncbi:hypothetical protein SERLA73DRAFT_156891 [Serpula lacrymans var. lacrymans S7.3]|uniref:BHLH domain-containing protein n=1 Tax=Serpula lacrymans var. lacrymans (strain S7.3) TaxID=936435 RepID=F8QGE9_SERL3|nr:hypothetical protein SERLA73DRAFT_156891 [Serpula lacrymans var. lacrymans S7.3]
MSSPNQQTRVSTENESYSVQGEGRVEREGHISHAVLAPSAFYLQDKTQTEPYSGTKSSPTLGQIQPDMGASASSSLVQTSPVDNGPGEGAALIEPSVGERDRQRNNLRMRGIRQQLKDQKDRIKILIPRRTGRALPSSELQLWTAAAEYIEYLQADNVRLKEQAKIQAAAPIHPKRSPGMPALASLAYQRCPTRPGSLPLAKDIHQFLCQGTTMYFLQIGAHFWQATTQEWSPPKFQSRLLQWKERGSNGRQSQPASAQGNMSSQYSGSASDPVWDPGMLNHQNDYLAPWNEILGQRTQTDVHETYKLNHGVGHTGAHIQTHDSTEGLSRNSANSGMQDYRFVFEQPPGHQGNHIFI